jgi:2-polyprenyl-3-methyl-5-hydroxy-6-metoxy-1,4-benzoquinol methylase
MPAKDAARWNARYRQEAAAFWNIGPRPLLIEFAHLIPDEGLALDAAMGLGGSAGLLDDRGLRVVGVDISIEAVRGARNHHPRIMPIVADLSTFRFPPATFDVIVNFYYLDRKFAQTFPEILKPGGLLMMETLTIDMLQVRPEIEPEFLLNHGELGNMFPGLDILMSREGWLRSNGTHEKAVASIVARRPVKSEGKE